MMKILFSIIMLVASASVVAQSGKGIIQGTIQNNRQEPVSASTITLSGTKFTVAADDNGDFTLRNIPAGSYTLLVSGVGYSATKQNVMVTAGKTTIIDLQLNESRSELMEVRVLGNRRNRKDAASSVAARMPLTYLENPRLQIP